MPPMALPAQPTRNKEKTAISIIKTVLTIASKRYISPDEDGTTFMGFIGLPPRPCEVPTPSELMQLDDASSPWSNRTKAARSVKTASRPFPPKCSDVGFEIAASTTSRYPQRNHFYDSTKPS